MSATTTSRLDNQFNKFKKWAQGEYQKLLNKENRDAVWNGTMPKDKLDRKIKKEFAVIAGVLTDTRRT